MKYLLFILFYFQLCLSYAQHPIKISVTDIAKKPLADAVLTIGPNKVLTNAAGHCIITSTQTAVKISVHKFGFADTLFMRRVEPSKKDTLFIAVRLRYNPTLLQEVAVSAGRIEELNPLKADFILGYELQGNYLIEVLSNDYVLVTDLNGTVRSHSKPLVGVQDIARDVFGYVYLVTESKAFMVAADSSSIRIDMNGIGKHELLWCNTHFDEAFDTTAIMRRYKDLNQTTGYYVTSQKNKDCIKLIKVITDVDRKNAVKAFGAEAMGLAAYLESLGINYGNASNAAELELIQESKKMTDRLEMTYSLPAYNTFRLINDSLYLFAHDIDTLFVYDKTCKLGSRKAITYQHLKMWDKELIVNEEKTKVYAKLLYNGKPALAEVVLTSGTLSANITTLDCNFATKIRIKNNKVYFISKQKNGIGRSVYSQSIN